MADEETTKEQAETEAEATPPKGASSLVPSYRLREEADAKRVALAQVADLSAKLEAAETARRELAGQLDAYRAEVETERGLWQVGISDPKAVKVARLLYAELPETDRPAIAEWAQSEPALAPFRQGSSSSASTPPPKAKGAVVAQTGGASAGAPVYTPQQLRDIQQAAQRSGDWTEWDRARSHVLQRARQ
jgi:hypothetical protein